MLYRRKLFDLFGHDVADATQLLVPESILTSRPKIISPPANIAPFRYQHDRVMAGIFLAVGR